MTDFFRNFQGSIPIT